MSRNYHLGFLIALTFLSACETSPQMRVRDGNHPKNIDDNVRFRTTYYFRSFDYCYGKNLLSKQKNVLILPDTDSLYRFRMTGKAQALTDRVHFESGTLTASQIDPFGAKVVYDETLEGFRFSTQEEFDASARRAAAVKDIEALEKVYRRANDLGKDDKELLELKAEILRLMKNGVGAMTQFGNLPDQAQAPSGESQSAADDGATAEEKRLRSQIYSRLRFENPFLSRSELEDYTGRVFRKLKEEQNDKNKLADLTADFQEGKSTVEEAEKIATEANKQNSKNGVDQIQCPTDAPVRRGYQIMGPEGWRTFNQDERLLMAMSTSARPLISVMQEYSDRILNSKADATSQTLVLTQEHLRILRAERELDLGAANGDVALKNAMGHLNE